MIYPNIRMSDEWALDSFWTFFRLSGILNNEASEHGTAPYRVLLPQYRSKLADSTCWQSVCLTKTIQPLVSTYLACRYDSGSNFLV